MAFHESLKVPALDLDFHAAGLPTKRSQRDESDRARHDVLVESASVDGPHHSGNVRANSARDWHSDDVGMNHLPGGAYEDWLYDDPRSYGVVSLPRPEYHDQPAAVGVSGAAATPVAEELSGFIQGEDMIELSGFGVSTFADLLIVYDDAAATATLESDRGKIILHGFRGRLTKEDFLT